MGAARRRVTAATLAVVALAAAQELDSAVRQLLESCYGAAGGDAVSWDGCC